MLPGVLAGVDGAYNMLGICMRLLQVPPVHLVFGSHTTLLVPRPFVDSTSSFAWFTHAIPTFQLKTASSFPLPLCV